MGKLLTCLLSVCIAFIGCSRSDPKGSKQNLPGIIRQSKNVYLTENHNNSFIVWHSLNIKNATVVHVDTHDDSRFISSNKIEKTNALVLKKDYRSLFLNSDVSQQFNFKVKPSKLLYDLGNFIYPSMMDGTISNFYWVIPDKTLSEANRRRLKLHLIDSYKISPDTHFIDSSENSFSFTLKNTRITVTTLNDLPSLKSGALLDFDIDFFAFPYAMTDNHILHELIWDPQYACRILKKKLPNPRVVTISSSVPGGYLPVSLRFIPDGCFDFFTKGVYPEYANQLLKTITQIRNQKEITEIPVAPSDKTYLAAYYYTKGFMNLLANKPDDAITLMEKAATELPVYRKGLLDAAYAFINMENPTKAHKAINAYEQLTRKPTVESIAARTRTYILENNFRDADKLSKKLVEWNPSNSHLLLRGGCLTAMHKFDEAISMYNKVLVNDPNNALAYYNIGVLEDKTGFNEKAKAAYKNALLIRPGFANAHENLGKLLLKQNKTQEAILHFKECIAINPSKPKALNNLGLALFKEKKCSEAIEYLRKSIAISPNKPETHANMALVLDYIGKHDDAKKEYLKAQKINLSN